MNNSESINNQLLPHIRAIKPYSGVDPMEAMAAQALHLAALATHGDLGDIVATRQFSIESGILRERERAPT